MNNSSIRAAKAAFVLCMASSIAAQVSTFQPTLGTTPVPSSGDAADDMVVWVHPTTPSLSLVIGTDKNAGIAVYDMTGAQLQFLSDGDKVLLVCLFRGRQMAHKEVGEQVIHSVVKELTDIAKVEAPIRMEGRRMVMLLTRK